MQVDDVQNVDDDGQIVHGHGGVQGALQGGLETESEVEEVKSNKNNEERVVEG